MNQKSIPASPWSPLRVNTFRWLWIATLVSNIGSWMHDMGAGWLMTGLTTSPVIVALLQTATSLPAFFLLLPSGALSDILDRRKYLMCGNIGMSVVAIAIAFMTITGLINQWSLLLLTLMLGIGMAMIMPTWQSIIPEVVPRAELGGAIGLNTLGVNVSRAIGPLMAGLIIAHIGTGAVFVCNALSFAFIIFVLARWKRAVPETQLPPERISSAIATGLRYARYSPPLRAAVIRSIGFYFFASVMWSLLPLIARVHLRGNEQLYSWLYSAISLGAVGNVLLLPRWRMIFNDDQLLTVSSVVFAFGMSATALTHNHVVALLALCMCGGAWITVMTCAQTAAQTALPNWVRSRGMALFLTFFMGSLGIGPVVWGSVAQYFSISTAMLAASIGVVVATLYTRRWCISENDNVDHTPSRHWLTPAPKISINHEQGPVMVNVRYEVQAEHIERFLLEVQSLGKARRRDGATFWHIFSDTQNPGTYVEMYVVNNWLDHLRQHERISRHDARIQEGLKELLRRGSEVLVTQFVNSSPTRGRHRN
ncbi:MAG: MFS transporter [Rhodanobacter sp.]